MLEYLFETAVSVFFLLFGIGIAWCITEFWKMMEKDKTDPG